MTDHTNTNPPGTLEAPSSPIPADAGGAVEVAVPPAGRAGVVMLDARGVGSLLSPAGRALAAAAEGLLNKEGK